MVRYLMRLEVPHSMRIRFEDIEFYVSLVKLTVDSQIGYVIDLIESESILNEHLRPL